MENNEQERFKRLLPDKKGLFFCLVIFFIVYGVSVGVRLAEAPKWKDPGLEVQGEKLLATHDAYVWLAGAKETSRNPDAALARITDWTQSLSGARYGNLGFWLPAFVAPLAVIPFILLGRQWRLEEGALPAAILAASCQGYLLRTRLGFYDTDILSLFFPLLVCVFLIMVFTPYLRAGWRRKANLPEWLNAEAWHGFLLRCIGIGLVGWSYMWFYNRPSIMLCSLVALAFCIIVLARNWWQVGYLLVGILGIQALALAGWVGLVTSGVFFGLILYLPRIAAERRLFIGYLLIFAFLVFLETELSGQVLGMAQKVLSYAKILPATEEGGLSLPTVKQSIREAQSIDWGNLVQRVAGSWLIFIPAVIGFAYVVWLYPATLVFVPMLGLAMFSFKLGNRFTMYGGAVIGLGLGFGAAHILRRIGLARSVRVLCLLAIAVLIMLPIWDMATKLRPAPVVSKPFAKAYIDLKEQIPKNARLWQWWDFGYAAQYYAERITISDGGGWGKSEGLFPHALVHSTHSPRQASQMMHYITKSQEREYARNQTAYKNMPEFWKPYLANPIALLADKGPKGAQAFVESLAEEDKSFSEDLPPQYLVLTWQNMSLAYWISHFGNWDLVEGEANPGRIRQIRGEASFNTREGTIQLRDRSLPLEELTLVREGGIRTQSWPNSSNVHAVLNQVAGELFIMDGKIYDSMMVRMLLGEPAKFEDHFELVMDRAPWVRVYRAK